MFFAISASRFPLLLLSPDELLDYLLGLVPSSAGPLAQAALVSVSLLAAFLTVAQVWQTPPVSRSLAADPAAAAESGLPASRPVQPRALLAKLLGNNFSRTILGGLAGLLAVTILASFLRAPGLKVLDVEAYYLVLFVAFFLSLLLLSALFRSLVGAGQIFYDAFFNVIQGKNQLQAAVLSDAVNDLHEALVEAAERTRDEVRQAVISALVRQKAIAGDRSDTDCVRVAVSLLSWDDSKVYSVTRDGDSLSRSFPRGSVDWIAAYAMVARWYRPSYAESPETVVFDNERGDLPEPPEKILLGQVSGHRGFDPGEAFVVLPMPWTRRGAAGPHRRGAIHISFRKSAFLDALWGGLESFPRMRPNYEGWQGLLVPGVDRPSAREGKVFLRAQVYELGFVLHQALEVLGEALGFFDDEVFNEHVQLRRHM